MSNRLANDNTEFVFFSSSVSVSFFLSLDVRGGGTIIYLKRIEGIIFYRRDRFV